MEKLIITRRNKTQYTFLYDSKFKDNVSAYSWSTNSNKYAKTTYLPEGLDNRQRKNITLHNYVFFLEFDLVFPSFDNQLTLDHINRDRTNNCLSNLRPASRTLQALNRESLRPHRGTSKCGDSWLAYLGLKKLGAFDTREEASFVYEEARKCAIMDEEARVFNLLPTRVQKHFLKYAT